MAGDMNRSPEKCHKMSAGLNLLKAHHDDQDWTRKQIGSPNAILDYVLSTVHTA